MSILLKLIHELNQPLTVMKAYLCGCLIRLKKNELSSEQIINVLEKLNENSELFENKVYSMQQVIMQEEYRDIPTIITDITSLFSFEVQHLGIRFVLNFDETNTCFSIDKSLLMQIVFRILKQCIATVEENKIHNAELTIQTQPNKEGICTLVIKSNFLIKESLWKRELNYCRSLFIENKGTLTMDVLSSGMCFNISLFEQGGFKSYQIGVG